MWLLFHHFFLPRDVRKDVPLHCLCSDRITAWNTLGLKYVVAEISHIFITSLRPFVPKNSRHFEFLDEPWKRKSARSERSSGATAPGPEGEGVCRIWRHRAEPSPSEVRDCWEGGGGRHLVAQLPLQNFQVRPSWVQTLEMNPCRRRILNVLIAFNLKSAIILLCEALGAS